MTTNTEIIKELADISANMRYVTETQDKLANAVWGNGKQGLVEMSAQNQRDIIELQKSLQEHLINEKTIAESMSKSKQDIKLESRRLWYSIILLIVSSSLVIVQAVMISKLVIK